MSLGRALLLYLVGLHLVFLVVVAVLLWERRWWLIVVEIGFLATLLAGASLARRLAAPARYIEESVELVRSQDFTTRFREAGHPEVRKLVAVYNQMAERLHAERVRNQEQEGVLGRVVEASTTGIVFCDHDERVVAANPAATRLLGEPEPALRGRLIADLGGGLGRELAALEPGASRLVAVAGRRLLCRKLQFVDRGAPRPFVLIEELTEELDRSERSAYEKLIRMMSHEVHNTSAAVISLLESSAGYLARCDQASRDRGELGEALAVAVGRTRRLDAFMRRLAEVVRLPPPRRVPCRLPELIAGIERLLRPESEARGIAWQIEVDPGFPEIELDAEQIEQVLLNLCRNALEAIDRDGRIAVRLLHRDGRPRVVVEDSGGGIPPAALPQLFTPFFTTKPDGAGVGLTLAREVLHAHGFEFRLEDRPAGGAAFTVWLSS